jgi:NAD(P)H-flavin reductase
MPDIMVSTTPTATDILDPMTPRIARVRKRRRETSNVFTLDIETEDSGSIEDDRCEPGQFNMLTVFGVGEIPVSSSGERERPRQFIHTVRGVGPVSMALTRLRPGDAVGLRGPFGCGWPVDAAEGKDVLLVAGGLGAAPLRSALHRLLLERERYGRLLLLYGTRSPEDILFRRELGSLRRRLDLEVEVTVDHAVSAWHGHVGVVNKLIDRADFDPLHGIAFICGPEIMMRFAVAGLREAGLSEQAIHLSMERNMKCAVGLCGHCQFGPVFVCREGPVFPYERIRNLLALKEI